MSFVPSIHNDQFTISNDCSVWSARYQCYLRDTRQGGQLADLRSRQQLETAASARPDNTASVLILGFGVGDELLGLLDTSIACTSITIVEQFPPTRQALRQTWSALGLLNGRSQQIIAQWPASYAGLHRMQYRRPGSATIEVTLAFGEPRRLLDEFSGRFDSIHFNPTLGGLTDSGRRPDGLGQLRRISHSQTVMTGTTAPPHWPQTLQQYGVTIQQDQTAWTGQWRGMPEPGVQESPQSAAKGPTRIQRTAAKRAIILGAGIAGLSIARELASADFIVTILEQGDAPLAGGSAQPMLAGHLHFSRDDNPLARLTRAAQALQNRLNVSEPIGRLQLLPDASAAAAAVRMVEQLGLPPELVQVVSHARASELAGIAISESALWQPSTRALDPHRLLAGLPANIDLRTGIAIQHMHQHNNDWVLSDAQQQSVASAPIVIVCTGSIPLIAGNALTTTSQLITAQSIVTTVVAGQTTRLTDRLSGSLRCIVGADAYACPLPDGSILTGASYRPSEHHAAVLAADRQANIAGWYQLTQRSPPSSLTDANDLLVSADFVGRRHTTVDHLPLIGPLADERIAVKNWSALHRDDKLPLPLMPGLYMAGGFGSRGSLWSALAAAVLRDLISGEQPPLERSLVAAIAPHRFLRKAIRRYDSPDACKIAPAAD